MLPPPLVEQYWNEVREFLHEQHQLSREQSQQAATDYRHEVEPKAGDMLYHRDAKDVANTIAIGVRNGSLRAS